MLFKCLYCSEDFEETFQFCSRSGVAVDKEETLIRYFQRGFDHLVITYFTIFGKVTCNQVTSRRSLYNRLRERGLR